jgi:outer membrane protein assembly factor BamB
MVGRRTPERYPFIAALAALVLAACSSTAANPTAPAGGPSFGGLVLPASGGWLTYHRDLARSGLDASSPSFRTPHEAWRVTLDGAVYAEPLISGDRVLVATENDSVYALDAASGRTQWYRHLGSPMSGSQLPCGDIDPSGITSTPVIDPSGGVLYVVAFLRPGTHQLFALDLADGSIRWQRPIDPPGASPIVEQQRAGLSLAGGMVYVPFGGLFGDCGAYHGYLVGVRADGTGSLISYQVPASREGAIWAPSGAAVDGADTLYVATGNTPGDAFDFGNSVIRLSPHLKVLDWFAPTNWQALSRSDTDLGSLGPSLLPRGLVFQAGKEGVGYLLHADHLGGVGGEAFAAQICAGAFGGTAFLAPHLFVPCLDGLTALTIAGGSFTVAWRSAAYWAGAPIIAGGVVWVIDTSRATLNAYDPQTGSQRFSQPLGAVTHFATPAADAGRLFVPAQRTIITLAWSG